MSERPPHQRWIKRPPRASRLGAPQPPRRERPGMTQLLLALGFGLALGIMGAILGPRAMPGREGIAGLFAGLGFAAGFFGLWSGFGGTRADIKDLFR